MEGGAQGAGEGAGAVARQNLQQRLLDAVKQARDERFCRRGESSQHTMLLLFLQCQIHFGARQEMATETDLR